MEVPKSLLFLVLVTSLLATLGDSSCVPNKNCRLPNCRCWNDPQRPGNLTNNETPMMLMLTFSYAVNNHSLKEFEPLFDKLANPNGCSPKGTFFAQDADTEEDCLARLYKNGHEIGLTTSDGSVPTTRRAWAESLFKSSMKLIEAGIPRDEVKGIRAPGMTMGGDAQFEAAEQFDIQYDTSCVFQYDTDKQLIWPYTHDFTYGAPKCGLGLTPKQSFQKLWQFTVPEITYDGHTCTIITSCSPYIKSTAEAYFMLIDSFRRHYQSRTPMVLYVDPLWMSKQYQAEALEKFLQTVSNFPKVWLLTMTQALEWIKTPVPMYDKVTFPPWECSQKEKMANKHKMSNKRRR